MWTRGEEHFRTLRCQLEPSFVTESNFLKIIVNKSVLRIVWLLLEGFLRCLHFTFGTLYVVYPDIPFKDGLLEMPCWCVMTSDTINRKFPDGVFSPLSFFSLVCNNVKP